MERLAMDLDESILKFYEPTGSDLMKWAAEKVKELSNLHADPDIIEAELAKYMDQVTRTHRDRWREAVGIRRWK
jgi:hypothetical protein